ncbi:MAG: serine/threonine-protein kinase PknK, partial [Myxococcales bacterium]|nr:serine/threonine-protein kinase PknK [Myxococcales bacterium]
MEIEGFARLERLHDGGQAVVYRAWRVADGLPVVLKILKGPYPTPAQLSRFADERRLTERVRGPGVVEVEGWTTDGALSVLVLRDRGCESLDRVFPEPPSMDVGLDLARRIVSIVQRVHRAGVLHLDLNPANIVHDPASGTLEIIDFGVATDRQRLGAELAGAQLARGTPAFSAPEQTGPMNRSVDHRSDLYALGSTLYWLFTGQPPFPQTDALELVHAHVAREPRPPDEIADIPSSLAAVILKLLEKSPEDRYQSASGLLADLDRVASGEPFTPGDRDRPARFAIPERLYGRQAALDLLLATFDRVRRGGREVVFVEGVAGMGKTSLVLEACRTLQHRGGAVVTGKFDPFERNRPYASLARALGQLVRRMLGERPEDVERWRARIREAVGPNGAIVVGLIPELAHLLGEQPAVPELPALESEARLHRTVRRFVRALGDRQRPLVLFLDDLQWADPPSLALLRVLATDASSGAVLLIGAYRSDAVGPVLRGLLHELRTSDVHVAHLGVGPLTVDDVAHLLRDTLYRDDVEALAVLCRAKTGGNPFFLNRFLVSLAARDLVRFDGDAWIWDTPGIAAIEVTENVVDFLTARLAELPEPTQRTLRTASVVGGRFGEARVAGLFPEASFDVALDQGLVEELPPDATGRRFRFAHDRVREAAYATLETSERERLHAALGASLLADDTRLYEVVEHLNAAGAPADPAALGALNLRAGERALAASAHAPAATWLEVARELLGWDTTPESMRRATELAARAAYLTGDHDHMDALVDEAYGHARDAVDRIRALRVRIDARISQNRNSDAIRVGLDALRLVGIDLPARPTEADVGAALGGLPALLDGVDLAGLPGRPPPDDEAVRAAMELTCALAPPAYFVNAVLLPLLGMELVRATVTHGPTAASSYGFALLGLVLCSVGEIDDGYAFGQLALALADGFEDRRARVRSRHVTLGFVRHWKEPASTVLVDYRALFDEAVDIGDFEYAGYIGMMVTIFGFYTGSDLTRVLTSARHYTQVMEETRQEPSLAVQRIVHQGLLNLRGEAADPLELTGELCNEARMLGIFEEIRDPTSLFVLHVIKGVVAALYGAWDVAGRAMDAARGQIHGATSTIHLVALDQWEALRALRDAREGKG